MGEFLRRHQEMIVSRVAFWHGDIDRDAIVKVLRNFRFVSDTYGLVIPAASTRRAAASTRGRAREPVAAVELIDVRFTYPGRTRPALDGVSLRPRSSALAPRTARARIATRLQPETVQVLAAERKVEV